VRLHLAASKCHGCELAVIALAHPEFRDGLERQVRELELTLRSFKRLFGLRDRPIRGQTRSLAHVDSEYREPYVYWEIRFANAGQGIDHETDCLAWSGVRSPTQLGVQSIRI
jgi:hypothetical protein